ncbi:hypothetical protein BJF78_30415 [Pseudonocardia sp. CNS-139]|nr:hypothetical protein BJF78_30415 [Pseudonocardia sp. CNS-139]
MTVPHQQSYGNRAGYRPPGGGPPPPPPRPTVYQVPTPRDTGAVLVLRVVAYVLTSLASIVFIALVIYGYVQYQQTRAELEGLLGGGLTPSVSLPTFPAAPPG